MPDGFDLLKHGINVSDLARNLPACTLYEEAIRSEPGSTISARGALIAYSGTKTGRSPSDKRIVQHPDTKNDVWWGDVNIPIDESSFDINRERATDYLNTRDRLFVVDGFAGWDPKYQIKVRVICARPYHALFMRNMLIRPTKEELVEFGEPDCVIFNAGAFPANSHTAGMTSKTSVDLESRTARGRDTWYRIRRRNEEGGIHADELLDAEDRSAFDALLGYGVQYRRFDDRSFRFVGNWQDDVVGRPEAFTDRRRRTLLDR